MFCNVPIFVEKAFSIRLAQTEDITGNFNRKSLTRLRDAGTDAINYFNIVTLSIFKSRMQEKFAIWPLL